MKRWFFYQLAMYNIHMELCTECKSTIVGVFMQVMSDVDHQYCDMFSDRNEVLIANKYGFILNAITTNCKKLSPPWEKSLPGNQENTCILWNLTASKESVTGPYLELVEPTPYCRILRL